MVQNEVQLQLHARAYNIGVFLQGADLPDEVADWSLTSLRNRLIRIGARVVRHARAITFQLAEVASVVIYSPASSLPSIACARRWFPNEDVSRKT